MNKEELFNNMEKCFAMSQDEISSLIAKKIHSRDDKVRLVYMLDAIMPYLKNYVDKVDEKLKRKVGKVFLSKLDYSQFSDSSVNMHERLLRLFYQIDSHGVNPYKVLYCSVLTDGNLVRDSDTGTKYYDTRRDFDKLYDSLVSTLGLTQDEAVGIFEKCSTLIAKGYAYKFPHVYNKLSALMIFGQQGGYYVLRAKEVAEILKINPSLFVISTDRIQDSFDYLQKKMFPKLKNEFAEIENENPNMTLLEYEVISMRKWLKNNSTLLTINPITMFKKEKYLKEVVCSATSKDFAEQFNQYFHDPINLAIINAVPYEKITKNAIKNISLLKHKSHKETSEIGEYLEKNPYIIGMDSAKLGMLLDAIKVLNDENPGEKYFDKFFELGKTLFASDVDFSEKKVIDKLLNNAVIKDVDVENMNDKECLHEFVEIFFDGSYEKEILAEKLIKEKELRNSLGEKELRGKIRQMGQTITQLPKILKNDEILLKDKKSKILKLAENISVLNDERFRLAQLFDKDIQRDAFMSNMERKKSQQIEDLLNDFRNIYEEKKTKLGKKYSNVDVLFERTMNYLSEKFDDKEALTDLFKSEIIDKFSESVKNSFDTEKPRQQQLFGEKLIIKNVGGLRKSLKDLDEVVNKLDFGESMNEFVYEK